jgi:hypothetical protein
MTPAKLKRAVREELALLVRQEILTAAQFEALQTRYPAGRWDVHSLGRWALVFGAVSTAVGASFLFHQFVGFNLETGSMVLAFSICFLLLLGQRSRRKQLILAARALELLAGIALIGLSYTIAFLYAKHGSNWAGPLLPDLAILLVMSYALLNPLLLVLSIVVFFSWFGGVTGYLSGWGAYYFGMNYPLRFLAAAVVMCAFAVIHMKSESGPLERYRGFSKIWLSAGVFFGEMSLWILSIFGNFGDLHNFRYEADEFELLVYNLLWGGANALLIWFGTARAARMLVGYGVTFLVIQLYTLFFQYVAGALGPFLTMLAAGGSALWLAFYLEGKRRALFSSRSRMSEA